MPSVAMNRMMDRIRTNLPGALDATIQAELFQALDDFCRKTNVWRMTFDFDIEPIPQPASQDPDAYIYQIQPPAGSVSFRLLTAYDDSNVGVNATMPQPNYIQFYQSPNTTAVYNVLVAMTVLDPVTRDGFPTVPDWIIGKYGDTLMYGTMAKMQLQAAKPYSAPEQAVLNAALFKRGVGEARIGIERGNRYNGQNWRFPQSFAVRRY